MGALLRFSFSLSSRGKSREGFVPRLFNFTLGLCFRAGVSIKFRQEV